MLRLSWGLVNAPTMPSLMWSWGRCWILPTSPKNPLTNRSFHWSNIMFFEASWCLSNGFWWFLVVRIQAKPFQLDRKTRSSPRSCRPLSPRMPSSRALSSKFALGPTSCATCCNRSWMHRCWSTWVPELFWSFSDVWKIGGFLKWGVPQNHGETIMKWSNDLDDRGIPILGNSNWVKTCQALISLVLWFKQKLSGLVTSQCWTNFNEVWQWPTWRPPML